MWKLTRRGLWSHKRRLISTSLAVVLGVAFLTATLTLGDTMRGGIDQLLEHGNAETDVIVRNATKYGSDEMVERGRLDGGLVAELTQLDGVAVAAPSIEGFAQIEASDGDPIGGNGPPTLAGNWIDDPRLNPFEVVEGRAPAADGEVVIDRRSAQLGDLQVGDHTTLRTPDPLDVEIVGIAKFGSVDSIAGASFVAFTNDQARDVLVGGADEVSSILVMGDDGISPEQLRSDGGLGLALRGRGSHRRRDHRRDAGRHRGRLPRLLRDVPADVRRRRPPRRDVQHPQHVLDPGRPTHSRIGARPRDRRLPWPGVALHLC